MHMSNITPGMIECKQTFGMRQPQETEATSGEESLSSLLVVGVNADYI